MPENLTIGVCICDGVTLSDYIPPMEIIASLNMVDSPLFPLELANDIKHRIKVDYIAPAKKPIYSLTGVQITVNPTRTYQEVLKEGIQYDVIWVPAGPLPPDGAAPLHSAIPQEQIDFIRMQAPKAKYIMSVCAGSIQLAAAGVLEGKRATSSKYLLKLIFFKKKKAQTTGNIEWVHKARWVVDGNVWTSSGVASGKHWVLSIIISCVNKKFRHRLGYGVGLC